MSQSWADDETVTRLIRGGRADESESTGEVGALRAEVARRDALLKAVIERLPNEDALSPLHIESRLTAMEGELAATKERFRELHALLRLLLDRIDGGSLPAGSTAGADTLVTRLNENVALMQAEIEALRHDLTRVEVESQAGAPSGDIDELRRDVTNLSERRAADRAILAELRLDLEQLASTQAAEQAAAIEGVAARLTRQTADDQQALEQIRQSLSGLRAEGEGRVADVDGLRRDFAAVQNNAARAQDAVVALRDDVESLRAAAGQRSNEITALRRTLASEQQANVKLKRDLGALKASVEVIVQRTANQHEAEGAAEDRRSAEQAKLGQIQQDIAGLREHGERQGQRLDGQQRELGLLRDMVTETRGETTVLLRNVALLHDRLGAEVTIASELRADIAALRQARGDAPAPREAGQDAPGLAKLNDDLARLREAMSGEIAALREGVDGLGVRLDAETGRGVRLRADLDALLKMLDSLPAHAARTEGLDALAKDVNEVRGEFAQLRDKVAKFLFEQMRQARAG